MNKIDTSKYDKVGDFNEGLAKVVKNGKWGFINRQGKVVIPLKYEGATNFSEGLAGVKQTLLLGLGESKWGFINNKGKKVISFKYDEVNEFHEGIAMVCRLNSSRNSICFFIDKQGEMVTSAMYRNCYSISKNLARGTNNLYGVFSLLFINNESVTTLPYDDCSNFSSEGLARVVKNDKYGFINDNGDEITPCQYDKADEFNESLARVFLSMASHKGIIDVNGKWGFINQYGQEVIPLEYDEADKLCEGLVRVKKDNKYGFFNNKGEVISLCQYDIAFNFNEGLAMVCSDKKYGFINNQGKIAIPLQYDKAGGRFNEGLASVKKDNKYGFINKQGDVIIPFKYDDSDTFHQGVVNVKVGDYESGKWGYIDKQGNIVIPFQYDYASAFKYDGGLAVVEKDSKKFYINKKGEYVKDS